MMWTKGQGPRIALAAALEVNAQRVYLAAACCLYSLGLLGYTILDHPVPSRVAAAALAAAACATDLVSVIVYRASYARTIGSGVAAAVLGICAICYILPVGAVLRLLNI